MQRRGRFILPFIAGMLAVVVVVAVILVAFVLPQVQKVKAEVVRFQKVAQVGSGPFTAPADVRAKAAAAALGGGAGGGAQGPPQAGSKAAPVGGREEADQAGQEPEQGTFGGTGSNRVCDREKLIKSLVTKPERLRAWAEILKVEPTREAVAAYVRKLRPVNLTRDTPVTNHRFAGGKAVPYQAIMQKGTAVLVDKDGKPVVRCRCGNPLTEPVELDEQVKCINCPSDYKPPPPCEPGDACYRPSPNPPPVGDEYEPPRRRDTCAEDPSAPGCDGANDTKQTAPESEELPSDGQQTSPDAGGTPPAGGGETVPDGGGGSPPEGGGTP
jgi:hypothetical protein